MKFSSTSLAIGSLILWFSGASNVFAQEKESESYHTLYTDAQNCLETGEGDCADPFLDCISYLKALPSDTLAGSRFLELGAIRMRNGRWDDLAKELFDLAHWRNKRSEMPCAIMESQFALSKYARFMNVQDSLQVHAERALESAIACGNRSKQARAEVFVGSAFLNQSNYAEALRHFQEAESIYESLRDSSGLGGLYLDMALLYSEMHQKTKARSYTLRASEIFKSTGEEMKYGVSLVDLSGDLIDVHEADSALQFLEIAEPILSGKHPRAEGYMQQNFGSALFLLDRYSEAIEHYQKGLVLTEKVGDISLTILLHNFISECYLEMGMYPEAYREALISDSLSAEISKSFTRTKALLALAESAYKMNDPDKTYAAFK
ncbi:MAG: tetratricopeptide repeat protein, partial [Flavobacteriales bacterium]|nr:tetratricopeptide repeat protein [Flavobacteriales bacterium]